MNDPYGQSPTVPSSVWKLSDRHIQNDIAVEFQNGQRIVTIAQAAFTYAEPLLAEIEGVRGRFFSKRLHRAVVRFVTIMVQIDVHLNVYCKNATRSV